MHDDILVWIAELRARLARGELTGLKPLDIGYGISHLSGERTVQIMLSDLDDLDELARRERRNGHPPSDDDVAGRRDRWRYLIGDFQQLRAILG
jgi:hypothetical protein